MELGSLHLWFSSSYWCRRMEQLSNEHCGPLFTWGSYKNYIFWVVLGWSKIHVWSFTIWRTSQLRMFIYNWETKKLRWPVIIGKVCLLHYLYDQTRIKNILEFIKKINIWSFFEKRLYCKRPNPLMMTNYFWDSISTKTNCTSSWIGRYS